jgi:Na+/H+-dicarboxylate symporter
VQSRGIALAAGAGALTSAALLALGLPLPAYSLALLAMALVAFFGDVSPNVQIAVASIAAIVLGAWPESGIDEIQIVGRLFIALLKMLIAPMILLSIVYGIAGMSRARDFGRIGSRTLALYVGTMALAVATGLVFVNLFEPGAGSTLRETEFFADALSRAKAPPPPSELALSESLTRIITSALQNPVRALADGQILPIVSFAVMLGLALLQLGERVRPLVDVLGAANSAVMHMIGWFVRLAPIGIFALLGNLVATTGFAELARHLGAFAAVVLGATLVHAGITLPLVVRIVGGTSPLTFLRGIQPALLVAFSTSSSAATLPVTTRCVEDELDVPPEISSFVLPLGATVNMDGTALYEAIAALFVANIYGIELSLASQLVVFAIAMISAIGAPGIPSAGMVTMVVVLESVGLPSEAVALLLTIDRVLDTVRTMANVEGDAAVALCVSRLPGGATALGTPGAAGSPNP